MSVCWFLMNAIADSVVTSRSNTHTERNSSELSGRGADTYSQMSIGSTLGVPIGCYHADLTG